MMFALFAAACAGGGDANPTATPSATPTPAPAGLLPAESPPSVPFPTPLPYPTLAALSSRMAFNHPADRLQWDGPDDRVSSQGSHHCGPPPDLKQAFGIPAVILIQQGTFTGGYLAFGLVPGEAAWRWTGYYYGQWQLWQAGNGGIVYVLNSGDPAVAIEYRAYGCD